MSRVLPILFNGDMVRAILDGRKNVTRRVVKQAVWENFVCEGGKVVGFFDKTREDLVNPINKAPYQPGDILYVRETWAEWTGGYIYRAWPYLFPQPGCFPETVWHPSIHMPKEAARIWLKVTGVRVERLQEIDEQGGRREGFVNDIWPPEGTGKSAAKHFADFWDSTIRKADIDRYGRDANPWVWVIEFERCVRPEVKE